MQLKRMSKRTEQKFILTFVGAIVAGLGGMVYLACKVGAGTLVVRQEYWRRTIPEEECSPDESLSARLVQTSPDNTRALYMREQFAGKNWAQYFLLADFQKKTTHQFDVGTSGDESYEFRDASQDLSKVVLRGSDGYCLFDVVKGELKGLVRNETHHCSFSKAERINASAGYKGMSADGEKIVFDVWNASFYDGRRNKEVYLLDVVKQSLQNLSDHEADDKAAAVSPDGKVVAFVSNRNTDVQLFVYNVKTRALNSVGCIDDSTSIDDVKNVRIFPGNQKVTWEVRDTTRQHIFDQRLEEMVK